MNKKLLKFSTQELEEELNRRSASQPFPNPIEDLSWEGIIEYIEEYGMERLAEGKDLKEDFEHSVFKSVMEQIYGEDVWHWWNLYRKKRK